MPHSEISREERKLLGLLQQDGRISNADLAQAAGMSASPCWRKVRSLEERGVIRGYAARLDRRKLGLGVLAYVSVQIDDHAEEVTRAFEEGIAELPEVTACHQVTGGADYLLVVVSEDLDSYAVFANDKLRRLKGIKAISSSFVLREAKAAHGLPV